MKTKSFLLIFLVCALKNINAQDLTLLRAKYEASPVVAPGITTLKAKQRPVLNYFNPVFLGLKGAMYIYQTVLSPQVSASCAYRLSCSKFSKEVIYEYGVVKGILLSADRLTRCNDKACIEYPEFLYDNNTEKVIDEGAFYHYLSYFK